MLQPKLGDQIWTCVENAFMGLKGFTQISEDFWPILCSENWSKSVRNQTAQKTSLKPPTKNLELHVNQTAKLVPAEGNHRQVLLVFYPRRNKSVTLSPQGVIAFLTQTSYFWHSLHGYELSVSVCKLPIGFCKFCMFFKVLYIHFTWFRMLCLCEYVWSCLYRLCVSAFYFLLFGFFYVLFVDVL